MSQNSLRQVVTQPPTLSALGLTDTNLAPAIQAYADGLATATLFHPKTHGGYVGWSNATAALRAELVPSGWHMCSKHGLERVISPDRRLAILVMSGDTKTGIPELEPSSRYGKGPAVKRFVFFNSRGIALDGQMNFAFPGFVPEVPPLEIKTWCLLFKESKGVLRTELSFPTGYDKDGYVCRWGARIHLDPYNSDRAPRELMSDIEGTPEIDIDIEKDE